MDVSRSSPARPARVGWASPGPRRWSKTEGGQGRVDRRTPTPVRSRHPARVFDCADLTPRERLLAAFDIHPPLCPFIAAALEIPDPGHPARVYARDYKQALAARLTETAREARAANPEPRRATGAAPGWRLGPQPSPQHLNAPPPPSQQSSSTPPSPRQRYRPAQALSSSTARMTMTPAGVAPYVPAVARRRAPWPGHILDRITEQM